MKTIHQIASLLTLGAVCFGCNPIQELDPDTIGPTSGDVLIYQTTANQSKLMQTDFVNYSDHLGDYTIQLDPATTYQEIDGFGAALTGSSAFLLTSVLDATHRETLLQELFNPESGLGINYLRIPVGASDFSMGDYTYCDTPGLTNFSMPTADSRDLLPLLKRIVEINPNIKLMATPWSAPAWMKTSGTLKGGSLKPANYADYAQYLIKYLKLYQSHGIAFDALSVQNEPEHEGTNMPTMKMTWQEQNLFIRDHLGPLFASEGITTKIVLLDHNFDLWEYASNILNDPTTRTFVAGTGFHAYGGSASSIDQLTKLHPDKAIYFTEQSGGGWGGGFSGDLIWFSREVFMGTVNRGSRNILLWNLALDPSFGPQNGGCSNCRGVVTVDGQKITRNVEYYLLGQYSKHIRSGAKRIGYTVAGSLPSRIYLSTFANADGSKTVVILNDSGHSTSFSIRNGNKRMTYQLSDQTLATFYFK